MTHRVMIQVPSWLSTDVTTWLSTDVTTWLSTDVTTWLSIDVTTWLSTEVPSWVSTEDYSSSPDVSWLSFWVSFGSSLEPDVSSVDGSEPLVDSEPDGSPSLPFVGANVSAGIEMSGRNARMMFPPTM